jgi:hypothetical protein
MPLISKAFAPDNVFGRDILSAVLRGKFVHPLKQAFRENQLRFEGDLGCDFYKGTAHQSRVYARRASQTVNVMIGLARCSSDDKAGAFTEQP